MYETFFGFKERPFQLVPNPAYLFLSRSHEEALAHLTYAVSQGDGFVELTGEVGTGKTTLCRVFLDDLDETTEVAYIFNPMPDAVQLLRAIHDEFGLTPKSDTARALNDSLNDFLLRKKEEGKTVILLIDEAQNLNRDVLEQLRLLSNLETNTSKLIQIILVGQPELRDILDTHELRQLRQRITLSCHISPLNFKETQGYIRHRMQIAARNLGTQFTRGACRRIFNYSGGIPRLINIACDRALLIAYGLNRHKIDGWVARTTIRELTAAGNRARKKRMFGMTPATALVLAGLLAVGLYFYISKDSPIHAGPSVNALSASLDASPDPADGSNDTPAAQSPPTGMRRLRESAATHAVVSADVAPLESTSAEEVPSGSPETGTDGTVEETVLEKAVETDPVAAPKAEYKGDLPPKTASGEIVILPRPVPSADIDVSSETFLETHERTALSPDAAISETGNKEGGAVRSKESRSAPSETASPETPSLEETIRETAPTEEISRAPVKKSVAKVLTTLSPLTSRRMALKSVILQWQEYAAVQETLDEVADTDDFFRLAGRQNAFSVHRVDRRDLVEKLNLPAVIELARPDLAEPVFVGLVGLGPDTAILQDGETAFEVSRDELARSWNGAAYIPWKNFFGISGTIPRTATPDSVMTLKVLLKDLGFTDLELTPDYDSATRNAIREVQRRHKLTVDGAVGPLTKIVLYNDAPTLKIPRLALNNPPDDRSAG